ncbi:hypothetical protein DV735_g5770, partial [Chaetothyriales sp. CBS 134920]
MAVEIASLNHGPRKGSPSPPDHNGTFHTIVVKTTETATDSSTSSERSSPNEEVNTATSHTPSSNFPPANGVGSPHKRRRSDDSNERASPPRQYDYTPPRRTDQSQHMADRALRVLDHDHGPAYAENPQPRPPSAHWSSPESHPQPPSTASSQPNGVHERSWDAPASKSAPSYEQDVNGQVKKRKRTFANRTKSGCMTCRRRKKKCDEGRPECYNCLRGGFTCEGYTTAKPSGMWALSGRTPVPLQSKESQGEAQAGGPHPNPSPDRRTPYENGQTRQASDDHERSSHAYATATEPRGRPPYPGQPWPPQQSQTHYTNESLPPVSEAGHTSHTSTPAREMPRPTTQGNRSQAGPPPASTASYPPPQAAAHPPPPPPVSQSSQPYSAAHPAPQPAVSHPPPPPPSQSPYYPPQPDYRAAYAPPSTSSEYTRAQTHSRMSSSAYDPKRGVSKSFFGEDVERSKMNRLVQYNKLDPTLVDDRKRCRKALARYNAACEAGSGLDDEQARRMLEKVFDPRSDDSHHFKSMPDRRGTLSHRVRIEPPFHCSYGYNLVMMDSVYIGENTTIDDSAKVEIGPRTSIGANVKIITSMPCEDLIDRKGSQGLWIAKEVYIGAGVIIGDNAIIYPDVRLENGVTVQPGAIVQESAPENAVLRAPAAFRPSPMQFP